jgi:hypothetical protein
MPGVDTPEHVRARRRADAGAGSKRTGASSGTQVAARRSASRHDALLIQIVLARILEEPTRCVQDIGDSGGSNGPLCLFDVQTS